MRKADIVDGRGVTTCWSTPDGLYESWRPGHEKNRPGPLSAWGSLGAGVADGGGKPIYQVVRANTF